MIDSQVLSFFVLAVASIASALGVILFRNAVHSALSLILTLLFLALFYLQLGAMFIAVVQILIYAGAIMVLFLFVVTMLASEARDTRLTDRIPWQRGVAATLGLILVGALSYLLFTGTPTIDAARTTGPNGLAHVVLLQGDTQAFGLALFHGFSFPFEVTSLLIVVAILGAMVLGRKGVIGGMHMSSNLTWYLVVSAIIFTIGVTGVLIRRNPLIIFMSIELMLNAVNLSFIAFSHYLNSVDGQMFVFLVLTVAAAEVVVGLAIIVSIFRTRRDIDVDDMNILRG